MTKLVLASSSPRRRELLLGLGLDFHVEVSSVEEVLGQGETPEGYVRRLSAEKATAVSQRVPDAVVIAADTIVHIDGQILEKPRDAADAERMLSSISGRTHTVFTGVTVKRGSSSLTEVERTDVTMSEMSAAEIGWYVATGEPMDKAGSYAVQGIGAAFVERIEGSYTNVVGLPLPLLRRMLLRTGVPVLGHR